MERYRVHPQLLGAQKHQITRGDVYVASKGRMLIVKTYFPGEGKVRRLYRDLAVLKVIRRYRIEHAVWPMVHSFILQDKLDSPSRGSIDYFSLLIGTIIGTINGTPRMSGPKLSSVQREKSCIRHKCSLELQVSRRTPLCHKILIGVSGPAAGPAYSVASPEVPGLGSGHFS